jgi:hypothetical protein
MDRSLLRALAVLAVVILAGAAGRLGPAQTVAGPPETAAITAGERAAGPRFAAEVAAPDRAWMLASIAAARPEAQRLIAEVDGLIEFRTHAGAPLGVTHSRLGADSASFVIDVDVASLNGRRMMDRDVTMLHELGHAIDLALVPPATNDALDAGIPRTGSCAPGSTELVGSCTQPAERFADTFAKWALRGSVSAVGAGYGVATPPSLEQWGTPLAALASGLPVS